MLKLVYLSKYCLFAINYQRMIQAPGPNEYKSYFQRYIDLVPQGDFETIFNANTSELIAAFEAIPASMHDFRYAEGKWSVKQMLMHIIDTERVFSYRMLVAGRMDTTTRLYSMDENAYADQADVSGRSLESLIEEFTLVRTSMQMLLFSLDEAHNSFLAQAADSQISARALGYISVGHAKHHLNVLKERYLSVQP